MRKVLVVLSSVLLVVVLLVGAWFGYWWLSKASTQKSAEIREDTFARQTALADEVYDLYTDIARLDVQLTEATSAQQEPLEAQRVALVERLCDAYGRLNDTVQVSAAADQFALQECY